MGPHVLRAELQPACGAAVQRELQAVVKFVSEPLDLMSTRPNCGSCRVPVAGSMLLTLLRSSK
jgi:hypothetical protein